MMLENPIVRDHHWNHDQVLRLRRNIPVSVDEPLHCQIRCRTPVEFAGAQAFRVLENHRQLVVFDDLLKH